MNRRMIWILLMILVSIAEGVLILKWKVSTAALIYYMETKKYTQPNKKEMEVCTKKVTEHVVRNLFSEQ